MTREEATSVDGLWAGLVRTDPQMVSGWHHHGDYETSIYVVAGTLRLESGPGGSAVVEAGPGDFLRVPKGAIHEREIRGIPRARSWWFEPDSARRWSTSMRLRR